MKRTTNKLLAAAIVAVLCAPMAAWATNGYFAHGYGTKSKGLAGGGSALPQDSMAAASNPAGMVFVGSRMDIGAAIFSPNPRSYETNGFAAAPPPAFPLVDGKFESKSGAFLVPHFGYNRMMDDQSSMGVSVYGNGGMNTEYKGDNTFYAGTAGVNLKQLFIAPTYARKIDDKSSWGISPILVRQTIEMQGVGSFAAYSADPSNLSDNGESVSTGYGLKIGAQGEVSPGVTIAGSYQTKMSMSEFDDYAGLFTDGGSFDIPATATIGIAWAISPDRFFTADLQKINYSGVDTVANSITNLTTYCTAGPPGVGAGCLGASDGVGFGWEDMTILKLGYQWAGSNGYTWRLGISKGKQPIPKEEVMLNILAPAVIETHITFGFSKEVGTDNELNFAAMYAPATSVKGNNPLFPPQTIELEMSQWELEGSWAVKF